MEIKKQRGQFFTTNLDVQIVLGQLISQTGGALLEPSAGAGHLVKWVEDNLSCAITAIELDSSLKSICKTKILREDFFQFSKDKNSSFDIILGNPPYVAWKDMEENTRLSSETVKANYSDKTNLYHLFIDKCIDLLKPGGELVLIVPKEWLYTSSANPLRQKIVSLGAITHIVDCGEEKLFPDASVPALLIFRFVKGLSSDRVKFANSLLNAKNGTYIQKNLTNRDGRFMLLSRNVAESIKSWGKLSSSYQVKVGMVSGADGIFRAPAGLEPESIKKYATTKGVEYFIDLNHIEDLKQIPPKTLKYLFSNKKALLARKIANFDETNWWKYGAIRNREAMLSNTPRFYALAKTRNKKPFFLSQDKEVSMYSGGLLGLFKVKTGKVSLATAIRILNHPGYRVLLEAMFLTTGDKLSLQPATLEDAPFPLTEEQGKEWLRLNG